MCVMIKIICVKEHIFRVIKNHLKHNYVINLTKNDKLPIFKNMVNKNN